jgi:hypothetical protein
MWLHSVPSPYNERSKSRAHHGMSLADTHNDNTEMTPATSSLRCVNTEVQRALDVMEQIRST